MILVLFTMYRAYGSYFRPLACQRVETRFYNMNRGYASLPHHLSLFFIERRAVGSGSDLVTSDFNPMSIALAL